MDPTKKQNQLLKQYVKTLEKQNVSKNNENFSLLQELQKLSTELSNITSVRPNIQTQSVSKQQFLMLQNELKELLKERDFMLQDFDKDMHIKTMECQHFQQEVKKLSQENAKLKSSQMSKKPTYVALQTKSDGQSANKIQQLSQQIQNFQRKIDQKDKQNAHLRSELQKTGIQLSSIINSKSKANNAPQYVQITDLRKQMAKKQKDYQEQIKQLSQKLSETTKDLQNTKQALTALIESPINRQSSSQQVQTLVNQLNQLQSAIIELETRNNKLQRDKTNLQNKIRELQSDNIQKSMKIVKLQKGQSIEQAYQTSVNVKDKQIKTLEILNQNLRNQIDSLSITLQQKGLTTKELEHICKQLEEQVKQKREVYDKFQKLIEQKNKQYQDMVQSYNLKIQQITNTLQNTPHGDKKQKQISNDGDLTQMVNYIDNLNNQNSQLKQQLKKIENTNKQLIQALQNLTNNVSNQSNQSLQQLKRQNQGLIMQLAKAQTPKGRNEEQQYINQLSNYIEDLQKHKNGLQTRLKNSQDISGKLTQEILILKQNLQINIKKLNQNEIIIIQLRKQVASLKSASNQKPVYSVQTEKDLKQLINELRIQLREVKEANQQLAAQRSQRSHSRSQSRGGDSPIRKSRNTYTNYHWIGPQSGEEGQPHLNQMQTFPQPNIKHKQFISGFTSHMRSQIPVSSNQMPFHNSFRGMHMESSNYDVDMGNRYDPYDIANLTRNAEMQVKNKQIQSKMVAQTDRAPNLNRQKWQNLQRKINSLREENEQLKKSLFE